MKTYVLGTELMSEPGDALTVERVILSDEAKVELDVSSKLERQKGLARYIVNTIVNHLGPRQDSFLDKGRGY